MIASLLKWAEQLRDLASELFYPLRCAACQRVGVAFCSRCLATIRPLVAHHCPRCDRPLEPSTSLLNQPDGCPHCQSQFPSLNGLRVFAAYASPLKEAIHALKYGAFEAVAEPLGQKLAETWRERGITIDGVLPVPLHPERVQERGYNQSELLANALCNRLHLPLHQNLLQRMRPTRPQVGLNHAERLQNVVGAFAATSSVAGGRWLLVDDVCTSGATLEGCATALRANGAKQVWAAVLARPLQGDDILPKEKL